MAEETQPQDTNQTNQAQTQDTNVKNVDNVKGVAALAYIIFFLPLITNPDDQFAKFHANQGLLLAITGLVVSVVGAVVPIIGWFIIGPLGFLAVIVLAIMGIINAVNGEMKRLPLIGHFDILT